MSDSAVFNRFTGTPPAVRTARQRSLSDGLSVAVVLTGSGYCADVLVAQLGELVSEGTVILEALPPHS
ncbi:hypothetical protein [Streptomyces sp. NPDC059076]|uniref:hypothetical protein n=1 Tax=unclassified Streptomyces TaxID=2593676 RepID=UPI0036AA6F28